MTPTVAELRERINTSLGEIAAAPDGSLGREIAGEELHEALDALCILASQSHSEGYRAGVEASELVAAHNHRTWCCPCASAIRSLPVPSDREKKE